jgi:hypothetical protein
LRGRFNDSRRLAENFAGAFGYLDVNCVMVKRALCVAMGLLGTLLPAVAQPAHHSVGRERLQSNSAFNVPLSLSLYRPQNSTVADNSLLLHHGLVPLWLDGPQASTGIIDPGYNFESQWVQMGFMSQDILPTALSSAARPRAQTSGAGLVHGSDGKNLAGDGKDNSDQMLDSPLSRVYGGGEVGFLYGRWSGKGGGDMWESYIVGTVGNDKFQITAGASYDEWNANGRSVRFRSFAAPR